MQPPRLLSGADIGGEFLPPAILAQMETAGGRGGLQERLTALKQLVASS